MNHKDGSKKSFIDWSDFRSTHENHIIYVMKKLWNIMCYIRLDNICQLTILPSGIRIIISEYISDIWIPKSDKDNNSTYFLTRTINQRINHWGNLGHDVLCKIDELHYETDKLILKKEFDGEYVVANICIPCLKLCTLDEIGLNGFCSYTWYLLNNKMWYSLIDDHHVAMLNRRNDLLIVPRDDFFGSTQQFYD
jgi:hypothetical protein